MPTPLRRWMVAVSFCLATMACSKGPSQGPAPGPAGSPSASGVQVSFPSGSRSYPNEAAATDALVAFLEGKEEGKIELTVQGSAQLSAQVRANEVELNDHGVPAKGSRAEIAANMRKIVEQLKLRQCKANLANLGAALEGWAAAHQGAYPDRLTALVPAYLASSPLCPSTGEDTYSSTFKSSSSPPGFEVACSAGHSSCGIPSGYPRYTNAQGMVDKPR